MRPPQTAQHAFTPPHGSPALECGEEEESPKGGSPKPRASARGAGFTVRTPWRVTIIASAFYPSLSRSLIQGASKCFTRAGIAPSRIQVLWAPGAFELPVIAARVLRARRRPDAVIALGALIRGQTPQYEIIAHAVAQALAQLSVDTGVPVTFGVIVATSMRQANARASGAQRNRGAEAARAALDVLQTLHHLK